MRMLGDMRQPSCPRHRDPPGLDCPDKGKDTRAEKRLEQRQFRREVELLAEPSWLHVPWLHSGGDCRHGCNGDCLVSGSPVCDLACHDYRCENCMAPGRHWLDTGWFCSYECLGEYVTSLVRSLDA